MGEIEELRALQRLKEQWQEARLKRGREKGSKETGAVRTDIGLDVKPLYTPQDLSEKNLNYERDLGFPGQYPFTRGIRPSSYREERWIIRAYSGFGDPKVCNARYRKLLEWGVDEIVIAADLPTQLGYDSDHVMSKGEVGKVGVAIDTLRDMEILFDDIPLNDLRRVSLLGNSFGPVALSLFIALGEKQGLNVSDFVVDLQNDVLKEYVARGTYIVPIRPAVRVAMDVVGYCARNIPHWYPSTLCVNHMNAAGAGSSRATAFALANGVCYMEHLLEKGYQIDEIAPLFTMFLDERADFFVTICNSRATRRLWAKIMKERMKARNPESMALKITAYSHGGETLMEPANNIIRISLAALAYVFGGVQFLYNASYDEVLGTPTEDAAKIAVRTQQILAHEFGIANTIDPLGGSYFIETLTSEIEHQIYEEFMKVDSMGGAISAIEKGYYVSLMNGGAIRRQNEFDRGERIAVGVNKYRTDSQIPSGAFRVDPGVEASQVERLQRVKKERDGNIVKETLEYVRRVAEGDGNLVPPVLDAVRAYATIGEICDVLRDVFGEHQAREYYSAKR